MEAALEQLWFWAGSMTISPLSAICQASSISLANPSWTAAPQAAVFKGMGSLSKAMGGPGISTMFFVKPGTTCPAGSTSFQMGFALVKISSTF